MNSPIFHLATVGTLCFGINNSQGLWLLSAVRCDWVALHLRVLIHLEILRMFCISKVVRVPSSGIHKVCLSCTSHNVNTLVYPLEIHGRDIRFTAYTYHTRTGLIHQADNAWHRTKTCSLAKSYFFFDL
jgi:hypothetical protein